MKTLPELHLDRAGTRPATGAGYVPRHFEAQQPRSHPSRLRNPHLQLGLLLALVEIPLGWAGYFLMFSRFAAYDDEGYVLTFLKSFVQHGHLYDRVYSEYGPLFSELMGAVFSLPGFAVNHDHGRLVTLTIWLLTSLIVGISSYALTLDRFLAVLAEVGTFAILTALTNEPMHPIGLLVLLAAVVLGVIAFVLPRSPIAAWAILGTTVGAMTMVKANVGVLVAVAMILSAATGLPPCRTRRWLLPTTAVCFIVAPVILTSALAAPTWPRGFGLVLSLSALCCVLAFWYQPRAVAFVRPVHILVFACAALLTAILSVAGILLHGTSLKGAVQGIAILPLAHPKDYFIPAVLSSRTIMETVLSVPLAFVFLRAAAAGRVPHARGVGIVLRVIASVVILAACVETSPLAASMVWLVQVPLGGTARFRPHAPGPAERIVLSTFAVVWFLNQYPVAGSQTAISVIPCVVVGLIVLADATRLLRAGSAYPPLARRAVVLGAPVAVCIWLLWPVGGELVNAHAVYEHNTLLRLPGTGPIRVAGVEARALRRTTAVLKSRCATFYSEPGLNSFYFFTGQETPSLMNGTSWMEHFTASQQADIVRQLRQVPGLCILYSADAQSFWLRGRPLPDRPLVEYIAHNFHRYATVGIYEILVR